MSYIHVYSICYEPFLFRKPLVKNTFFKSFPKKMLRLWISKIYPSECGFYGFMIRFWICPAKKTQYLFLDSKIWIWIIPKKTHPLRSWSERVFISQRSVYTNDTADWFRVCSNCVKLKKTTRKTHIVINCVKLKFKTNEKDVHCFREDLNFSVCLSLKY